MSDDINQKTLTDPFMVLPPHIRQWFLQLPTEVLHSLEEVRLRQKRPLQLTLSEDNCFLREDGTLTANYEQAYMVTDEDIHRTTELVSHSSIYAFEEELKNGYITMPGGHRVGIAGKIVAEANAVKTIKYISGFNIRISREVLGSGDELLKHLISPKKEFYHTLLISPPRCGKTTLLRDLVRQLSNGVPQQKIKGMNVGVVDERSEIAGCYRGVPQLDVGVCTDVLDACPKAVGMMMLLRSMSPNVIATDEIGRMEDVQALEELMNAGVKVLTTVHGSSLLELQRRPAIQRILRMKVIERLVILGRSRGVGTVEQIIDGCNNRTMEVRKC